MENQNKSSASANGTAGIRKKCWEFIYELNSGSAEKLDAAALLCGSRSYSYRQMFRRWERYAGVFSSLGITGKNHSRAGMTDIPAAETVFAFYGLNMTGASVSMIHRNDLRDPDRWEALVRAEGITDLVLSYDALDRELLQRLRRTASGLGIRRVIVMRTEALRDDPETALPELGLSAYDRLKELKGILFMDELLESCAGFPALKSKRNDDAAYIAHTSGTVKGIHKPVPVSDTGLNGAAAMMLRDKRFGGLRGRSVSVLHMGLSSAYAMADMLHLPLAFGGRVALLPGASFGEDIMRAASERGANVMFTSGAFLDAVMGMRDIPDLSSLEFVFLGGSYVSARRKRKYDAFLSDHGSAAKTSIGYGTSETCGACILADADRSDDSVGRPLGGVRIKLKDESDGRLYDPEDGPRRGVLCISSPSVSRGRLNGKDFFILEKTADGDFLNTYDLVDVDEEGNLFYAGRADKYFVNNEGIRFDAGIIETAMQAQPGIRECAVAPNYDKSIHDTVPVLYVSADHDETDDEDAPRTTERALRSVFVSGGLIERTNLPGQCMITDSIPYNENGKVDTSRLVKGRIRGRLYRVEPVRRGDRLVSVRLLPYRDAFGQRSGLPEELS